LSNASPSALIKNNPNIHTYGILGYNSDLASVCDVARTSKERLLRVDAILDVAHSDVCPDLGSYCVNLRRLRIRGSVPFSDFALSAIAQGCKLLEDFEIGPRVDDDARIAYVSETTFITEIPKLTNLTRLALHTVSLGTVACL